MRQFHCFKSCLYSFKGVSHLIKYTLITIWKSLTGEKNTVSAIWKIVYTAIGCISSVFAFAVLLNDLAGFDKIELFFQQKWYFLVLVGAIASFIINHEKISCRGSKDDDDLIISIKVKSLFNASATSYVIPTNSYFRAKMDDEYISPNSVQGAFQIKFFKNNLDELDRLISENLAQQGIVGTDSQDRFGNVKKYPLGTVAKVNHKNKHFYFVAINDVNQYGKPINQSYNNVSAAFNGLLTAIKQFGHCDDLAMPLIGTGRAAIRDATIDKVVRETIDQFINLEDKIARKIIICISPKYYADGKVKMKKISNYLEYQCEFEK